MTTTKQRSIAISASFSHSSRPLRCWCHEICLVFPIFRRRESKEDNSWFPSRMENMPWFSRIYKRRRMTKRREWWEEGDSFCEETRKCKGNRSLDFSLSMSCLCWDSCPFFFNTKRETLWYAWRNINRMQLKEKRSFVLLLETPEKSRLKKREHQIQQHYYRPAESPTSWLKILCSRGSICLPQPSGKGRHMTENSDWAGLLLLSSLIQVFLFSLPSITTSIN